MIKVSVLSENMAGGRGFLAEHGLSILLRTEKRRILFDTGQTGIFIKNADCLGEDLLELDGIVLSHGHFDHCGGMKDLVLKPLLMRTKSRSETSEFPGEDSLCRKPFM